MKTISKETDPRYLACPIRQVITRFGDKWTLLVLGILGSSDQKKITKDALSNFKESGKQQTNKPQSLPRSST